MQRLYKQKRALVDELSEKNAVMQRISRFKTELLSIVGHDMSNMFSAFSGYLSLFRDRSISAEEFEKAAPVLEDNLFRLQLTFVNLFRWAESQLDEHTARREEIDFQEVLKETIALFEKNAAERNLRLLPVNPDKARFQFDAEHLKLVLRNLVHNAIKFTPDGGQITVYAHRSAVGYRIGVFDRGTGVAEETRIKILKAGERITTRGLRREQGTGLGLQTTMKVLRANQTSLQITSIPGKGSDFYFEVEA
jgi:signal transduction histidine kinase